MSVRTYGLGETALRPGFADQRSRRIPGTSQGGDARSAAAKRQKGQEKGLAQGASEEKLALSS
jgi:hypothetical protein